ncbi:ABC transporter substrate-binding protein [Sanguibacter antarcticus]|uniref:Carbohydrate ABC transporter substrate-binding protein (CUT1 family) n=1 Tax=Sanguibacter antarcticus TaxID=372484 RepID=A0A2A9E3A6_9MICO|nr:ABC transporter substrate-binding protein [Sanguibacter antarcticus]PFG33517.1 carbohydrate ABC transporter substrate-binding protein (CUT1 family) [Sanguibacter antarcticus]
MPLLRLPASRPGRLAVPSAPGTTRPGFDRRSFLGLSAAGAAALTLAACAGPSTASGTAPASAEALDYTGVKPASTISMWSSHPGGSQEVEQKIIDQFNASQSAITVSLVTAGANYEEVAQRFQTALAGGGLPGLVILSDVWWFRYFINDSIIPLDAVLDAVGMETDDFRPTFFADYQYDGAQWAIPYARSTPMFYYNKEHWATAGLPDRSPATWEEFGEWAPRLKAADTGVLNAFQYPAISGYAGWTFQNNAWGQGGSYSDGWDITIDEKPVVDALEWMRQGVNVEKWAGITSNDQATDIASGAVSATVSSTGSLVGILDTASFDVGVGFMPGGPTATEPVCPSGGAGLGIPQGITPEEQVAAATFLKFLTSPENAVAFSAATGYIPTRTSADVTGLVSAAPQIQTAIDQIEVVRTQDYARAFLPGGDKAVADGVGRVLTQDEDPQEVLTEVRGQLEDIYTTDVEPLLS